MGSFIGYAVPGSFFIVFALWWTIQSFRRYFSSLGKSGAPYVSTPTWKVNCGRFGYADIEAKLVAIFCAFGMLLELLASPLYHGLGVGSNNAQHGTMYFFFGLVGVASLILPRCRVFPNHEGIVYCILTMAYVVEGLLFKFHLFGRDDYDVLVHTLLLYSIYACAICTLVEMRFRGNVLATLSRAFFTLLQGTWFWFVAIALYPPFSDPWGHNSKHMDMGPGGDPTDTGVVTTHVAMTRHEHEKRSVEAAAMMTTDHHALMKGVMVYAWHMATNFILMLVIGALVGCCYRRRGELDESKMMMQELNPAAKGYTVISLDGGSARGRQEEVDELE